MFCFLLSPNQILHQFFDETQVCQESHISLNLLEKLPKLPHYISPLFFVMYRPLQIQYSQTANTALRFIIPWSSLNKGPKFIPGIRALLSLSWDAGHLFWESCETLTCKPLIWSNPMSRTSDSSWSQKSVQRDPLPSKHFYLHLSL